MSTIVTDGRPSSLIHPRRKRAHVTVDGKLIGRLLQKVSLSATSSGLPTWHPRGQPRRDSKFFPGIPFICKAARPPHESPDVQVQRGHQHRAHDQRVEQDAQGDRKPDLGEGYDRQRDKDPERAGQDQAG
jgi:hypothetical protein